MINKFGNKNLWFGVVEDRNDPLFLGRCRVRVVGINTDNKIELPTEELPWAYPLQSITSAAMSGIGQAPVGPVEGTWVVVMFNDDSFQQPFMIGAIGGIPIPQNSKAEDIEDFLFNDIQEQATTVPVLVDGSGQPVTDGSGNVITVPNATTDNKLGNLSIEKYDSVKAAIAQKESDNDYTKVEAKNGNYLGKYQLGAAALEEAGYLKPGSYKKYGTKAVQDSSLWTGKNSVTDKESFLANPSAQESAMDNNLRLNYKRLGLSDSVPAEKQAGMLTAAHLVGHGGAKKYLAGDNPKDANGTSADSYYNMGVKAVTGQTTYEKPSEANLDKTIIDKNSQNLTKSSLENSKFDLANLPEAQKQLAAAASIDIGFTDPNKKYPKQKWLKEPDTHRLARHQSITQTIVPIKEQERDTAIPIANSSSVWDQSLIPYNATYPFNHVMESESGHIIELDDTSGMERIHIYHKTGTFIEIDSLGTITRRTKGNEVVISENDSKTHIMGSGLLNIDGDFAINVIKSIQIEVQGDAQIHVAGNMTQQIDGNYNLKVGGTCNIQSGSKLSLQSGSMLAGDAGLIHWNSGLSAAATPVTNFSPDLKILNPTTRQSSNDFIMETAPDDVRQQYIAEKEESNNLPREEEMAEEDKELDTSQAPDIEQYTVDCDSITIQKPYSYNTKLSPNYTLGDLCRKVGGGPGTGPLPPSAGQAGFTQDQIICNLVQLCVNIIEPLKSKYPDLTINSCFRLGSGGSQHDRGQAVDWLTKSAERSRSKRTEAQTLAIAAQKFLPYDQLILETSGGPTSAWVHTSFNPKLSKQRGESFTLNTSLAKGSQKTSGIGFKLA